MNKLTPLITAIILIAATLSVSAQNKPQVQHESVWAPDGIKTDGLLKEWPDKFLNAYNAGSRVYYVICNDDRNLYLAIRGLGTRVAVKALSGGITFTISQATEKKLREKDPRNISIVFPVPQADSIVARVMGAMWSGNPFFQDTKTNRKQVDSIEAVSNAQLITVVKEIKITGVKEITDSTLSIYNTQGIKAMAQFTWRQPVFELAIPLKYLGLPAGGPAKFSYQIKLNGIPVPADMSINGISIDPDPDSMFVITPTDFWGEYTLATKP